MMSIQLRIASSFDRWLCVLTFAWLMLSSSAVLGQQDSLPTMPDMSDFFDFDPPAKTPVEEANTDEGIDPRERPTARRIDLPDALPLPIQPSPNELRELSEWVRWITLRNLPPNYEDNRKWGKRKEVYNGVHMSMDGLRLDTKRKWKSVRQGTWSRYFVEFVDPANQLQIEIKRLDVAPNGRSFTTETKITTPLKIFARVSQWQRDVQLYSISMQADAVVELTLVCETKIKLNPLVLPPDIELRPTVTSAVIELKEFKTHEISQIRGAMADWIGNGIRKLLDRKIDDYNDKLVEKINQTLAKQEEKLRFSGQEWLKSAFSSRVNP